MKKEMIVCDKCKKFFEEKTSFYATVFINLNGWVEDKYDICIDCWHEMLITQQRKESEGSEENEN